MTKTSDIVKTVASIISVVALVAGTYVVCKVSIARNEERILSMESVQNEKWCSVRRDLDRIERKIDRLTISLEEIRGGNRAAALGHRGNDAN